MLTAATMETTSVGVAIDMELDGVFGGAEKQGNIARAPLAQPEEMEVVDLEEPGYNPEVDMMEPARQAPPNSPADTAPGSMTTVATPTEGGRDNQEGKCGVRLRWLSIYLLHLGTLIMPVTKLLASIFIALLDVYEEASCEGMNCPNNATQQAVGAIAPSRAYYLMLTCINIVATFQFVCGTYMFLCSCPKTPENLQTAMQVYCGFTAFEILSAMIYFAKMKATVGMVFWISCSLMIAFLAISVSMYYPPPQFLIHSSVVIEGVGCFGGGPQGREVEANGIQTDLNEGHGEGTENGGIELEGDGDGEQNMEEGKQNGEVAQPEGEVEQNGE